MSSPLLSSPLPIPLDWAHRQQAFALPDELVYLDAASRGPLLRAVQQVAHQAVDALATPWRLPFDAWLQQIEQLRTLAAGLFDHDADAVALLPSAAHGLATAARNLPLQRGDAVLVLEGQFPSNLLIWQRRCAEVGGRIVAVPTSTGTVLTDAVLQAIAQTPALRIASLPQAYWLDGRQLDLDRISAALQARGAALVLDLSQSLGVLPNDLPRWKPEFVVSVGHKWLLGPMGLAWLWAAPHWRAQGVPIKNTGLAVMPAAVGNFRVRKRRSIATARAASMQGALPIRCALRWRRWRCSRSVHGSRCASGRRWARSPRSGMRPYRPVGWAAGARRGTHRI